MLDRFDQMEVVVCVEKEENAEWTVFFSALDRVLSLVTFEDVKGFLSLILFS